MFKGHIVVVADLKIVCNIKFCREDRIVDNVGELNLMENDQLEESTVFGSAFQDVSQFLRFWKLRRDQSGWSETFNEFQRCSEGRQVNESW